MPALCVMVPLSAQATHCVNDDVIRFYFGWDTISTIYVWHDPFVAWNSTRLNVTKYAYDLVKKIWNNNSHNY